MSETARQSMWVALRRGALIVGVIAILGIAYTVYSFMTGSGFTYEHKSADAGLRLNIEGIAPSEFMAVIADFAKAQGATLNDLSRGMSTSENKKLLTFRMTRQDGVEINVFGWEGDKAVDISVHHKTPHAPWQPVFQSLVTTLEKQWPGRVTLTPSVSPPKK